MEFYTPDKETLHNALQAVGDFVKATLKDFDALHQNSAVAVQQNQQQSHGPRDDGNQPVLGKFTAKVKGVEYQEEHITQK